MHETIATGRIIEADETGVTGEWVPDHQMHPFASTTGRRWMSTDSGEGRGGDGQALPPRADLMWFFPAKPPPAPEPPRRWWQRTWRFSLATLIGAAVMAWQGVWWVIERIWG